jgi:hypothetical protein
MYAGRRSRHDFFGRNPADKNVHDHFRSAMSTGKVKSWRLLVILLAAPSIIKQVPHCTPTATRTPTSQSKSKGNRHDLQIPTEITKSPLTCTSQFYSLLCCLSWLATFTYTLHQCGVTGVELSSCAAASRTLSNLDRSVWLALSDRHWHRDFRLLAGLGFSVWSEKLKPTCYFLSHNWQTENMEFSLTRIQETTLKTEVLEITHKVLRGRLQFGELF